MILDGVFFFSVKEKHQEGEAPTAATLAPLLLQFVLRIISSASTIIIALIFKNRLAQPSAQAPNHDIIFTTINEQFSANIDINELVIKDLRSPRLYHFACRKHEYNFNVINSMQNHLDGGFVAGSRISFRLSRI